MSKKQDFAIIRTGGKQYQVHVGDTIAVELLGEDAGKKITFSEVLLLNTGGKTKVGTPTVKGASVEGTIEEMVRGDKVIVFKKKRRKGYQKATGHRQNYHMVNISKILASAPAAKKEASETN